MNDQTLQEDASDLFLDGSVLRLREEIEEHAREVVRVCVRVTQMVRDRRDEEIPPLRVKLRREKDKDLERRVGWREPMRPLRHMHTDVEKQRRQQWHVKSSSGVI